MTRRPTARWLLLPAFCVALKGCASPAPVAYSGLASSAVLEPNRQDPLGQMPLSYRPPVDWPGYDGLILEPVAIYRGTDAQFGALSETDKIALARYMQAEFSGRLKSRYPLVTVAGDHTLRVRLTLTGAAANKPVLSTVSRLDIAGGLYNGVQAARGGEGLFTGSVIYSVEFYNAWNDQLIEAFVAKQYPNAYNLAAGVGSLSAAKAGIRKGAGALLRQMQ